MPLHRRTRQVQLQGNFSLRKACCMEAMDSKESMLINIFDRGLTSFASFLAYLQGDGH